MSTCHFCGKDLGMGGGYGYSDESNGIGSRNYCVSACMPCLYRHVSQHYPDAPMLAYWAQELGIEPVVTQPVQKHLF